jgi:predicted PurR-regulated permease PerM
MVRPQARPQSSSLRTLGILVAVTAILYLAREILIPLAFAITLTLILSPAVIWLMKMHFGRAIAALTVVVIAVLVAGGISLVIFNQLIQIVNELPVYQNNIHNKLQAIKAPSKGALQQATENVRELGKELANAQTPTVDPGGRDAGGRRKQAEPSGPMPVQVVPEPVTEFQYLRELNQPFLAPLATLGIVLIFTIFLLIEQNDLSNRLFHLAGLNRLNIMTQALDDATKRVSRYLMLQFLVNAGFGVLSGIGLYLIGVPYAALWGTVAAILRIVPYIGSPIAGLLPLLLSLAVFDKWMPPLLVFVLFIALELVTANFLEPWLYGMHTGISSLALLLTTVFWSALWGPAGLILSTPLTVCLVVLGRHVPQFSFLHVLLGDEQALAPEAQLYQRLLAMDERGARVVIDKHLIDNPLPHLYDSVIIPTLSIVERDRRKGALDPEREEFIFLSIREMLGEIAERAHNAPDVDHVGYGSVGAGRVLCIPSKDESDEITAAMLAQLLETAGCVVLSFPTDSKLQRMIHLVGPTENDVFFISALPPFAFMRTRAVCSHLQRRFPKTKVVVGIWGFAGDTTRAVQRFQPSRPDAVVTSLSAAMEWLANSGVARPSVEPDAPTLVPQDSL